MATYYVSRNHKTREGEFWAITALTGRGRIAAGSVQMLGSEDPYYDVRTDAGAKCFRGTDAYDVRMAAVRAYQEEAGQ